MMPENSFTSAQRHVEQGKARVARQHALRDRLAREGRDTTSADAALAVMQETLKQMQEDLRTEEARAPGGPFGAGRG